MKHIIEGDWSLPGLDPDTPYVIKMKPHIFNLIKIKSLLPETVEISDICYKPKNDFQKGRQRYLEADTSYPGIIVTNMTNPENKKYRMIDGSRRLHRLIEDTNATSATFYILDFSDVAPYIEKFIR